MHESTGAQVLVIVSQGVIQPAWNALTGPLGAATLEGRSWIVKSAGAS